MWEIYAYQNADSLFGIFNAAAAIHGSGDYMAAVAAVAFCGFIAALVAYAFAPEKLQGWKWLGSVVLVFSVLIVPKVHVDSMGTSTVPASPCTRHRPSVGLVGARRWPSTGCSRLGWASPGGSPSFTLVPISPCF